MCGELIKQHLKIYRNDLVVEPSGGNEAFLPLIKYLSDIFQLFDIEPAHQEVKKQDFLKLHIQPLDEDDERFIQIIEILLFRLLPNSSRIYVCLLTLSQ